MNWTLNNLDLIRDVTLTHVRLAFLPIVLSFVLSIPLGWLANRSPLLRAIVITGGSLLYTIPSLPLFVILPLLLGTRVLDDTNLVVALTIYGVAIMARSAADALASVDDDHHRRLHRDGVLDAVPLLPGRAAAGRAGAAGRHPGGLGQHHRAGVGGRDHRLPQPRLPVPERQAARHPRGGRRRHPDQPAARPGLRRPDRGRGQGADALELQGQGQARVGRLPRSDDDDDAPTSGLATAGPVARPQSGDGA